MDLKRHSDQDIRSMEKRIQEIVGGPIILSQNGFADSDIYFARSWLLRIHSHVRRQQGDNDHASRPSRDQNELLAGVANRLGLDYTYLLNATPREEVKQIHDALEEGELNGYEKAH